MNHHDVEPGGRAAVTELGLSYRDRLALVAGGALLGVVGGFVLPPVASWLLSLRWVPEHGVLRLLDSWRGPLAPLLLGGVGLLAGVVLVVLAVVTTLRVTLTNDWVRLRKDDTTRTVHRDEIDAVFVDGRQLVILDRASRQLVREETEASAADVARAFTAHGYPFVERDPYEDLYRRWVPDTPDLPGAVNALLKARETALRRKAGRDVAELREEVQKLGFVVRDGKSAAQYWRPLVRP